MVRPTAVAVCACALTVLACGRSEKRTDSATGTAAGTGASAAAAPSAAAAAAPAPISIAQVEGTWHGTSMPVDKDTVLASWTIDAVQDTSKWVTTFSNGTRAPIHIQSVAGDSIVAQMGPYKSMTARTMVLAHVVEHVRGDTLVGTFELHPVSKPDSVVRGRFKGARTR